MAHRLDSPGLQSGGVARRRDRDLVAGLNGSPVRVLIVDDHEAFRSRARAVLESAGYCVVGEAEDAATAIAAAERLRPDVILLDVQLPDGDGFAVAEQISRQDTFTEIVIISSRQAADYGSRLTNTSIRGFIYKPDLSGDKLDEMIASGR